MKKDSPLYKYMKERMEQDDSFLKEEWRTTQMLYSIMAIHAITFIIAATVYAFN